MSDHLVELFVAVTSAPRSIAAQYLQRNNNDLGAAIEDFYASNTRTPTPPRDQPARLGGIRTLRDFHEDEDDKTANHFFTGGEKSALQVENPDKKLPRGGAAAGAQREPLLVEKIFQRAREQMGEADDRPLAQGEPPVELPQHFTGRGFRLGDGEGDLEVVGGPQAGLAAAQRPAKVSREITFWRQGFTVGDGELRRYDDPENEQLLHELKQGRVPVSLLNVEFGQDVDVLVVRKVDEDYTPPKRPAGGFHGQGQRLGLPVPGETAPEPAPVSVLSEPAEPEPEAEGDCRVQIRFANGQRVGHNFNSSDPVLRVYEFVRAHPHTAGSRPFVLSHTFPVKAIDEHGDETVALAKLKNAVIVQRWQ